MTVKFGAAMALVAALLAACGGGGDSAGVSPFGPNSASGNGQSGLPGGGISPNSTNRPTQRRLGIGVETYALNWDKLGASTTIEVIVADTAGNPVPEGTRVQFSSEVGGTVQTSCVLSGAVVDDSEISRCAVEFATLPNPGAAGDGLIEVIAWMVGEEAYVDLNGNGRYDEGEPFTDSGRIFRDDNHNGVYDFEIDELNLGETVAQAPGLGGVPCIEPTHPQLVSVPSVPNTCDGRWGLTLIRTSVTLPTSTFSGAGIALIGAPALSGNLAVFSTAPWMFVNANPVSAPAGTTVAVAAAPVGCTLTLGGDTTIPGTRVLPTVLPYLATSACLGAPITFSLTLDGATVNRVVQF